MSEHLIKAIVQLFALMARIDGLKESEREKMKDLINSLLGRKGVDKYLGVFDVYSGFQPKPDQEFYFESKDEILNKIKEICVSIKKEANQHQRVFLIIQLTQLAVADGILSELEDETISYIANEIHISHNDVEEIEKFLTANSIDEFDSSNILILKSDKQGISNKCRHLFANKLDGFIAFLRLPNIKPFFYRYVGDSSVLNNNVPIEKNKTYIFSPGSNVRGEAFGPIYFSDIVSEFKKGEIPVKVTFEAKSISYQFKNGNHGLRDVDIRESEGRLVGIMGASGSGKSTLINVLNGNDHPTQGHVKINGIDIHAQQDKVKGIIGYVPQDDLLMEDLTVFENLFFAAKLCFKDQSDDELTQLVVKTLSSLGIYEIKGLKVGSVLKKTISGGQRKRVNIGLELLREPLIMFIDEPTSGLSSRDSENIMDLLKELTLKGKLIFTVIHQPSSEIFKMFDGLLILDVGGYPIYYGHPVEAISHFRDALKIIDKTHNICLECGNVKSEQIFDIIELKVIDEYGYPTKERRISPQQWNELYKEQYDPKKLTEAKSKPKVSLKIPSKINQAKIFVKRDFLSKISNRQYLLINLLEAPVLALLLTFFIKYYSQGGAENDYVFYHNMNIPVYMFISVIVALFMGLTVSAEEIIRDRKILKREAFLHLSKKSYLASKLVILFGLSAIQTFSFLLVGNLIMEVHGMLFPFWLIIFSTSCFANVLGLNISSAFDSVVTIYILIPILLIPQLMLSGVMVKFDDLNPNFTAKSRVPVIGDMMASKWAYEAMIVTQFKENDYEKIFYKFDKTISNSDFKTIYYIPKLTGMLDYVFLNRSSDDPQTIKNVKKDIIILENEIKEELEIVGNEKFKLLDQYNTHAFDSTTYNQSKAFFSTLKKFYVNRHKNASKLKEDMIKEMTSTPDKKKAYEALRDDNTNEQVNSIALNSKSSERIIEENEEVIQKIYPIFMDPDPANFFDYTSQMFLPKKHFAGFYMDTLYFNVLVIWFMSVILVIALYFDVLKKIVNKVETGNKS